MWSPKLLNRLPVGKCRLSLIDKQMAVSAAKAINIPNNATVIEINSGLGFLTHALLNNTNVKRIIALENDKDCVENLGQLAEESSGRLEVIQAENNIVSRFASNKLEVICTWLQKEKLADMQIYPWEEVHPSLVSIFHLPDKMSGDYLLNQIMQDFYNRSGFQAYGRVRTNLFMPAYLYEKNMAMLGEIKRCKQGVIMESLANIDILRVIPERAYTPKSINVLLSLTPQAQPKLKAQFDVFEYVLRHVLSKKSAPLCDTISTLGAGAESLIKNLSFDSQILVKDISVEQFIELAQIFEQWPFRPVNLHAAFNENHKRRRRN
ncbi:17954_t:CDS:2 [Cetraspora pellucida]|uniref:rRNA adenine N(6)-methyltransferase n=1 Tax=Cetraspora pellucida TaxID=1433469 RepID=A0A9N9IXN5_9GLOM|nr:17954_t:CDS:2 [Cetraspora pellucida]